MKTFRIDLCQGSETGAMLAFRVMKEVKQEGKSANAVTHVFLFGSLSRFHPDQKDKPLELDLWDPAMISEVLGLMKIPAKDVSLAMVNYRSVPKDSIIQPGDRLSLFPREYPIFADWLDHRF